MNPAQALKVTQIRHLERVVTHLNRHSDGSILRCVKGKTDVNQSVRPFVTVVTVLWKKFKNEKIFTKLAPETPGARRGCNELLLYTQKILRTEPSTRHAKKKTRLNFSGRTVKPSHSRLPASNDGACSCDGSIFEIRHCDGSEPSQNAHHPLITG
jgi:hypothetical protein